jgi:hypothetical protein
VDPDELDGKRLEEQWENALDAAGDAVERTSRANVMPRSDAAAANERLRGERKWLSGFRSTLHRLFPSRRAEPPSPS